MPQTPYHLVIRGGTLGTAQGSFRADIAVSGATIAAIGLDLPRGEQEIDATGKLVLPGGVDGHAHIEQISAGGLLNADTFESATVSAAFGGTTTVIAFAAQHVGLALDRVVGDYHVAAARGAVIDYAFHMIIADPTDVTLKEHLPRLVREGHASIKVFMTYDRLRLDDAQLLDVLAAARENKALVCVHAENHGMIAWMVKRLLARGCRAPKFHGISHPAAGEVEAINRLITFAAFVDQPIQIFHVSTAEGVDVIRRARGNGIKVFAETCPQYLFLTRDAMDRPGLEGAKWMCSPPPRTPADQEALWAGLARGDLQTVSSDHAPYRFDASGKLAGGEDPDFKQIANGLPGLETRLPLLFDAMVSNGRLGLGKFVELTAEAPARLYGLYPRKGTIAVGSDADLVVWNPEAQVTLTASAMHDRTGYTPYEGMTVTGWPEHVFSRGMAVIDHGRLVAAAGRGRFLARTAGPAAEPTGRQAPELDPARNFGARLL
jgi:dihydropyrimidinase